MYRTVRTAPSPMPNSTTPGCLLLSSYQRGSAPPGGASSPQAVGMVPPPIQDRLTGWKPANGGVPLLAYSPNRNVLLVPSGIVPRGTRDRLWNAPRKVSVDTPYPAM